MNKLLLKWAHLLKDLAKLVATIANYASRPSFMTWTPPIKGEKVFGLAKCNTNYFLRVDDDFHTLDHINFFIYTLWLFP
jgi:hypothetical protein